MNNHIIYKISHWALLIVVIAVFTTCNSSTRKITGKRLVTDMAHRTMFVPDTIHKVYVNKYGSLLLYAIDPALNVCRTLSLTKVAKPFLDSLYAQLPYTSGSVEEIIKLKPDIIISSLAINKGSINEANQLAEKTGIPVFQVETDMNKYSETFDILGKLLYREKQTNRMGAFVSAYLDTITARAKRIPAERSVKVYYAEGDCGLETDPSGSMHSQVIDFVGATNVAKVDVLPEKGMSCVSMEQILLWNPDVILCWTGWGKSMTTYQFVLTDRVWKTSPAVKNGRVYQIPYAPFGWFDRPPGTNRIIGTIWTANLLYPDIFPYDMRQVTQAYFEIFYHHKLTNRELDYILNPVPEGLLVSDGQRSMDKSNK